MKEIDNNEPSLEKIDDYNKPGPKEKRKTVILVILFCLLMGTIFTVLKDKSVYEEYVGSEEKPGIVNTK